MVERIDILPGNQSSIYGSAAIAGVVNIILKKHIDGTQLDVRFGGYTEGGGQNERLQLTGGHQFGNLDVTWGLQYSHQDPIYMNERDYTDTTDDNPNPDLRYGSRTFIILNGFTGTYDDPGTHCDDLANLFDGTTIKDFRPGRGDFCGSRAQPGYATLLNEEKGVSAYVNATYALNDTADLYATVLVGKHKAKNDSGSRFWVPDINGTHGNYIWNAAEGTLETYQHIFAPEETPDDGRFFDADSVSYSAAFGIKGTFGDSNWDYDAYYSRSGYKVTSDQLWPLVGPMEDFYRDQFLGPQLGTYYGYPVYAPDKDAFYQATTPEQFRSFSGNLHNVSETWTQNVSFQLVNANLFEMPAGSVGMAAVMQAGNQFWDNPVDPRITNNEFFALNGTSGRGKRNNQALGVEFTVPLLKELTADVAVRYDAYQNVDAGSDSKPTYKIGLEFRPSEQLLFRANYATAFRAPDMGYIFTGGNGFFSSETDFYKCEVDPTNCALYTGRVGGRQPGGESRPEVDQRQFLRLRLRVVAEQRPRPARGLLQRQHHRRGGAAVHHADAVRRKRMPPGSPRPDLGALHRCDVARGPRSGQPDQPAAQRERAADHRQGHQHRRGKRVRHHRRRQLPLGCGTQRAASRSGWSTTSRSTTSSRPSRTARRPTCSATASC